MISFTKRIFSPVVVLSAVSSIVVMPVYTYVFEKTGPHYNVHPHEEGIWFLAMFLFSFFLVLYYFMGLFIKVRKIPGIWKPSLQKIILTFCFWLLTPFGNFVWMPVTPLFIFVFLTLFPPSSLATVVPLLLYAAGLLFLAYFVACIVDANYKSAVRTNSLFVPYYIKSLLIYFLGVYLLVTLIWGMSYI